VQEPTVALRQAATLDRNAEADRLRALMRGMFLTPGGPLPLLALSAVFIIPAIWALLSSPVIYSREMTWDLMFNLDGAWRLYNGQTAHVDFHDPLGTLPFAATALGFGPGEDLAGRGPPEAGAARGRGAEQRGGSAGQEPDGDPGAGESSFFTTKR